MKSKLSARPPPSPLFPRFEFKAFQIELCACATLVSFVGANQSRSQRLHSFWSAPRMQDLWDNQCQNAGESKSDWLLFFTGSLRERSVKTGNKST